MMKKLCVITMLTIVLALTGCGNKNPDSAGAEQEVKSVQRNVDVQPSKTDIEELRDYYGKGWYGWAWITDATGEYESMNDTGFDICGDFDVTEGPSGNPLALPKFWMYDKKDVEIASFSLEFLEGDEWATSLPIAMDAYPNYLDHQFIEGFDDLLEIRMKVEDSKGSFVMKLDIRPWGSRWDDVKSQYPENLPEHYNDWYLPLIDAGKEMP